MLEETEGNDVLIATDGAIRWERMKKGLSLRELNKDLPSMTYATLWHAERGYPVRPRTARLIAKALAVEIMDIFMAVPKSVAIKRAAEIDAERRATR